MFLTVSFPLTNILAVFVPALLRGRSNRQHHKKDHRYQEWVLASESDYQCNVFLQKRMQYCVRSHKMTFKFRICTQKDHFIDLHTRDFLQFINF